jgi:hypothetical protein
VNHELGGYVASVLCCADGSSIPLDALGKFGDGHASGLSPVPQFVAELLPLGVVTARRPALSGHLSPICVKNDTASWSYSRQVYAPGTTVARGEIWVWVDNTGMNGAEGWSVRCGATCEWVRFY